VAARPRDQRDAEGGDRRRRAGGEPAAVPVRCDACTARGRSACGGAATERREHGLAHARHRQHREQQRQPPPPVAQLVAVRGARLAVAQVVPDEPVVERPAVIRGELLAHAHA
jgi:hypothetical protein